MAVAAPKDGVSAGGDLDLQAVEGIPKDTLVALLRRKDKEAKALSAKLEKLEERYVKVVRFNKILMEDRSSFLRFSNELLPDSDGAFEEAAAQEIPVNLEALLRRLAAWRNSFEAATADRRVFQQFAELVFPGDEAVAELFRRPTMDVEAFDTLQNRWVTLEDLQNQSIASINSMAREQIMGRGQEFEAAIAAKQEAERRVEDLREQLTRLAREKAQMLTQRLGSGGTSTSAGSGDTSGSMAPVVLGSAEQDLFIQELRDSRDAAEQRSLKATEASAERERELCDDLDYRKTEVQRLQRELDAAREDTERQRAQDRRSSEEKDQVAEHLRNKVAEHEEELQSNSFIARLAEQQAGRDTELQTQKRQIETANRSIADMQKMLSLGYGQEKTLKERVRELESSHNRGHVASDYLKHVILKYVQYTQKGDLKAQSLVPVISTLLNLSNEEKQSVDQSAIPQPLLLINQAVGESVSWLRGDSSKAASGASVDQDNHVFLGISAPAEPAADPRRDALAKSSSGGAEDSSTEAVL